jgi:hypothetical protein
MIGPLDNLASAAQSATDGLFNNAINALSGAQQRASSGGGYPWSKQNSTFFPYVTIQPNYWDKLFPYRLIVIDSRDNSVVNGGTSPNISVRSAGNSIIEFTPMGSQWVFQLPITPQQLTITDQFAINASATLRGVVEEHSGVRFKIINAQGTMGVWAHRSSVTTPPTSPSPLQSIFGGTIEAFGSLVDQATRVINSATSNHPANKPQTARPENDRMLGQSTGYYQAMALQQFLEQYAEAKKDPKNAYWRLVLDIPKQNQSFVVTPMQFNWQQSQNKPTEVLYSFQLKAWRRVDLKQKVSFAKPDINSISPGILQRILNTITEARKTTSAALNLIGAVRSDVETPLDVLRQTSLLVKDLAGVAVTAADLPFQIQRDYASAIKDSINTISSSISTTTSDPAVKSALALIAASSATSEGLSLAAVSGGQLGAKAASAQSIDPTANIFGNPEKNFSLMNSVPVYSMKLNNAQQSAVNDVIADARSLTVDDLKKFRATMQELALQLSNNFGAGSSFYSEIYNRPAPTARIQAMTVDEYDILKTLYEAIQSYDILTATTEIDDLNRQTSMEFVAGLADLSGINFEIPNSKILVPVPFGLTIEEIALRYLGDAQRWLEIVTLNNLRDPYIDENGFTLPLLSNASGRHITVSTTENLYIGQRVIMCSSGQVQSARRILGIDRLSDTSYLITLDGEANLDNFVTADGAYLQAYLPGTVNSQQKIFIPSNAEVNQDPNIPTPASLSGDPLVGMSKVDWLLTDTGDLAVNSYGDFRFSAGMTNLIQAIKIKLGTQKGKYILHPEFGLGLRVGMMTSEVDAQSIYNDINALINDDPRFQGLSNLQIQLNGGVLNISMGVILAGTEGVFPLTFQLAA